MNSICNICGNNYFVDYNSRRFAVCKACGSFERHRLVRYALNSLGLLNGQHKRALHIAHEKVTFEYMRSSYGGGYYCCDPFPDKYPYASCLKLFLPDDSRIFTDRYFDLILHNHVLEHIPGS